MLDATNYTDIVDMQPQLEWLHDHYIIEPGEYKKAQEQPEDEQTTPDIEEIRRAMDCIPSDDYDTWIKVGMALKANRVAIEIWREWSSKSKKYNASEIHSKWNSFKRHDIGLGTLFHLAAQHGYKRGTTTWAEPMLFDTRTPPGLSPAFLPTPYRDYVEALSDAVQVPVELAIMFFLSVLATTSQRRFVICPFDTEYVEPVNIWTLTALPPGSRKTEIVKRLTSPLIEWQQQEEGRLKSVAAERDTERGFLEKRIDSLSRKSANSDDEVERESLLKQAAELQKKLPEKIVMPRLYTGDVTPERLQDLLTEQGGRMSVLADEGGIFEVMAGLYNDGRVNIDVFLQGHAGSPCVVDRGGRQVSLPNPALTFGLCVQPKIVSELSHGSKGKFRGIGCLARFLYALPPPNIGKRDVRKASTVPPRLRLAYHALITNLLQVPVILDENNCEQPRTIHMTKEAQDLLYNFAEFIEQNQGEGARFESIQDWTSKLPGAAARIIALCHIAEYEIEAASKLVPPETVQPVLDFCKLLIEHAQAAFDMIGADPVVADAKFAYSRLKNHLERDETGRLYLSENKLYQSGRFKNDKMERCRNALGVLKDRGIISEQHRLKTDGRSKLIRYINPAVERSLQWQMC